MKHDNYIVHHFIRAKSMESRDYQINLAGQTIDENCLIVLPTGLGKTAIAVQIIAQYLSVGEKAILFLAPTKVLVHQHYEFLKNTLTIFDIALITGEDIITKRRKLWENSVICATPEIAKNDLIRNIILPDKFGLVIFDEAHRSIGHYAYSYIASEIADHNTKIIGMTATLPSEKEKAAEIVHNLRITKIAYRTEDSPDVKPYIQDTKIEWILVSLSPEMKHVQSLLKASLDDKYAKLQKYGVVIYSNKSLSKLLKMQNYITSKNKYLTKLYFTTIRIHYALNMFESHGVTSFLRFCARMKLKKFGVDDLFNDINFTRGIIASKAMQENGFEHDKIIKLKDIVKQLDSKTIIFTSYRDSVEIIHEKLTGMNIKNGFLIGKAGKTGLKQKKQIETVQKFKNNDYKVLIATKVGEEGLDISEVNNVIFYDNVPSSIRFIQRKGRTGRKYSGKVFVLIAKNTIDETYYQIGIRKSMATKNMGAQISHVLNNPSKSLDLYF